MSGYFQDDKGKKSMMRLLSFLCYCGGIAVALGGVIRNMPEAVISGTGLAAVGVGMKGIQKKTENGGG